MFLLNNEPLNLKDSDRDSKGYEVAKRMSQIARDYGLYDGKIIRFEYCDNLIKPDYDNPGRMFRPKSFAINWDTVKHTDKGVEAWRYYEGAMLQRDGTTLYSPLTDSFTGTLTLGVKDLEKIFFLLDLFPYLDCPENKDNGVRKFMTIHNPAIKARKRVEEKQKSLAVTMKIYNDVERGGMSEVDLRKFAVTIGIPEAETKDMSLVQTELESRIMGNDHYYELFTQSTEINADDKAIRYNVNDAVHRHIIGVTGKGKERGWYYLKGDQPGDMILKLVPVKPAEEQLINYFKQNAERYRVFTDVMARHNEASRIDPDDIETVEDAPESND
jgi:hypothetical protein